MEDPVGLAKERARDFLLRFTWEIRVRWVRSFLVWWEERGGWGRGYWSQ